MIGAAGLVGWQLGDLKLRIRSAPPLLRAPAPVRPCVVAREFMQKIEAVVATKWKHVGPRFSEEDRRDLVCLVLLRVSERFTADDIAQHTGRVINFAKRVAGGAIADLLTDTRRYSKDDGIAPGLASLTSGPREVAYADDVGSDPADEEIVPEGLPTRGNSAPSSSCDALSEANDYPSEDELVDAIDERRTLERVRATLARMKNRQHRDPDATAEVDSTREGNRDSDRIPRGATA